MIRELLHNWVLIFHREKKYCAKAVAEMKTEEKKLISFFGW